MAAVLSLLPLLVIMCLQAPPSRPRGSEEKGDAMCSAGNQQRSLKSAENELISLHPEKLEVFKHLEGWSEKNLLPMLRPVEASWQDPSSEGFLESIAENGVIRTGTEVGGNQVKRPTVLLTHMVPPVDNSCVGDMYFQERATFISHGNTASANGRRIPTAAATIFFFLMSLVTVAGRWEHPNRPDHVVSKAPTPSPSHKSQVINNDYGGRRHIIILVLEICLPSLSALVIIGVAIFYARKFRRMWLELTRLQRSLNTEVMTWLARNDS